MTYQLLHGNNLEVLPTLPDNSVDSIVTDPPYELGFMGKKWDNSGIAYSQELWTECLRVLKPGGFLLSFGGTRTYHRVAVAIEDSGFELRDSIAWLYGSGFPKSMDISKAIDKSQGQNKARQLQFVNWMSSTGLTAQDCDKILKLAGKISETSNHSIHYFNQGQPQIATADTFDILKPYLPEVPEEIERLVAERTGIEWTEYKNRKVIGQKTGAQSNSTGKFGSWGNDNGLGISEFNLTTSATNEAKQWEGWGTALKPAFEPIIVARKPLSESTVAANVLKWGTGGINIDGSRIGTGTGEKKTVNYPDIRGDNYQQGKESYAERGTVQREVVDQGRWPANIILDEYTAELLDEQSGVSLSKSGGMSGRETASIYGQHKSTPRTGHDDTGGASRFFKIAVSEKPDTMNLCENTTANNVANHLITIRATIGNTALTSADTQQEKKLAQVVKDAGILCDSCGISIAQSLVELKILASSGSTALQDFMHTYKSSTLIQNLASVVEKWVSTDTIPTTTSLLKLFGSVLPAIAEHIKPESLKLDNDPIAFLYQAKASKRDRNEGLDDLEAQTPSKMTGRKEGSAGLVMKHADGSDKANAYAGTTGAARQNFHPTVKPTSLMEYLVTLVTPPNGTVLDPFTGSGSTGKAAILKGFDFIGIEMTDEYLPIIEGRLKHAERIVAERKEEEDNRQEETLF